jgi:predicted nucleic acid-binding protein
VKIVVDSNVLVALVIPIDYSAKAAEKLATWLESEVSLFAPALWGYEAVSAIRKFVAAGKLETSEAFAAVQKILEFDVHTVSATNELHRAALGWAERLNDLVAYDPAYLAVAEHLDDTWMPLSGQPIIGSSTR